MHPPVQNLQPNAMQKHRKLRSNEDRGRLAFSQGQEDDGRDDMNPLLSWLLTPLSRSAAAAPRVAVRLHLSC